MRSFIAVVLLVLATPVYAQTMGSTSGSTATVDINSPAQTTNRLITTPTVAAPGLTAAGVETCLGSASGGVSMMGGGFTFGATKVDEGCTIRLLARQLYAFGFQKAAVALMCEDEHVVLAMATVDSPCPIQPGDRAPAHISAAPEAAAPVQLSAAPATIAPTDQHAAAAVISDPTPGAIGRGGYILDLKPAVAERTMHVSSLSRPLSTEEESWFDRESRIN